jgi:hypothetical protein
MSKLIISTKTQLFSLAVTTSFSLDLEHLGADVLSGDGLCQHKQFTPQIIGERIVCPGKPITIGLSSFLGLQAFF